MQYCSPPPQATKIAHEVKKYLVDNNRLDVKQVGMRGVKQVDVRGVGSRWLGHEGLRVLGKRV